MPDCQTGAAHQHSSEDANQWDRPFLNHCGPQAHDASAIDHSQPGDQPIAQAARRAIHSEEAPARDANRAGNEDERADQNRRGKQGGKKDGEDRMPLGPRDKASEVAGRAVVAKCRFPASASSAPGDVSTQQAAEDCTRSHQPWIPFVGDHPQQQQIGTAGDEQRDPGGVDDRNRKESQRTQVGEPAHHRRAGRVRRDHLNRRWGKKAHYRLGRGIGAGGRPARSSTGRSGPPTRILDAKSLFSLVYRRGCAVKYRKQ